MTTRSLGHDICNHYDDHDDGDSSHYYHCYNGCCYGYSYMATTDYFCECAHYSFYYSYYNRYYCSCCWRCYCIVQFQLLSCATLSIAGMQPF